MKEAIDFANELSRRRKFDISHQAIQRLFARFWQRYVKENRNLDTWQLGFRDVLRKEADAIDRYRERRRRWERQQRERENARAARDFINGLRNRHGGYSGI